MAYFVKKRKIKREPKETLQYQGTRGQGPVNITIFDYNQDSYVEKRINDVNECAPFKEKDSVTWINIDGLHRVDIISALGQQYMIHHLVLEDILNINQRPKIEDFGQYVYCSAKMFSYDTVTQDLADEQVSFILGKNFLISLQEEKSGDAFDGVRERIRCDTARIRKMGPDYLLYALLDAIVDGYFLALENIGENIERIEESVVSNPGPQILQAINDLKRNLIFLRKALWPLREVVNILTKSESPLLSAQSIPYFRDVYDHAIQALDTVEAYRDMVSGMLDIYLSSLSNRLNEVMKVLTIISTIFIPLTFIAGIYGMNFNTGASIFNMPELNWPFGYVFVLSLMAAISFGMLVYFKKKRWF